jgi:hypothetical protein
MSKAGLCERERELKDTKVQKGFFFFDVMSGMIFCILWITVRILQRVQSNAYVIKAAWLRGIEFFFPNFMFCWSCISIHLCNKSQLDALFIFTLVCQSTSTCFGHICSPSSGGILYIYNNWYVLCFSVDCLLACRPKDSQLKSTRRTNCCIYAVYLLMMGYKYAGTM